MHAFMPYVIVIFIYLAVALDYWRGAKSPATAGSLKLHSMMIALGLAVHGYILYSTVFQDGLNLGFYNALSAILWLTVLIYWFADIQHKLYSLQAFVLPPAALFVVLQMLMPEHHIVGYADQPVFMAHITIALLAYSLFTFAALHALLMAIAERSLHQKASLIKMPDFPPLLTMENLLFRVIAIGFALLTLTLISGIFFSEQLFGKPMQLNHKTIFSMASWLIYAALLWGRYQYGWRGRKAIRWTLTGFVLLLLAYLGSKFVLQVLLGR